MGISLPTFSRRLNNLAIIAMVDLYGLTWRIP
jgi:hypothetical protein